jgi:hypothetical protein
MSDNHSKFDELVGKKLPFYGVDNYSFKIGEDVFEALEDESDGYRSCLGSVEVKDAEGLIFFETPIVQVTLSAKDDGYFEGHVLTDQNGHEWLHIGTENYDDYYPSFVFRYEPVVPETTI